jgi:hypothetical protein
MRLEGVVRCPFGLLLGMLTQKFRGPMSFWMGSYLTGRTQRVRVVCDHSTSAGT